MLFICQPVRTIRAGEGGVARLSKGPACVGICRVIWFGFLPRWMGDGETNDVFKALHRTLMSTDDPEVVMKFSSPALCETEYPLGIVTPFSSLPQWRAAQPQETRPIVQPSLIIA